MKPKLKQFYMDVATRAASIRTLHKHFYGNVD